MAFLNKVKRLAITTGDADGIGLEVSLKALDSIGPQKNVQYILYRNKKIPKSLVAVHSRVSKKFHLEKIATLADIRHPALSKSNILEYISSDSPPDWVVSAARHCLAKNFSGLVTAPMSKELIVSSGFSEIGHTEILKNISGSKNVFMGFLGEKFCVVLATGHVPLSAVAKKLTVMQIVNAAKFAQKLKVLLPKSHSTRPLGLVGLNPHAGENGLIGSEEKIQFKKALSNLKKLKIQVVGPLVPDAAFLNENWDKFSVFICPYHDQGLIPFKMAHGRSSGAHLTLGLPFVRTSPDHGTAKDIFGMNIANPGSMKDALFWANHLS